MRPIENRSPLCLVFATQMEAKPTIQYLQAETVDHHSTLFNAQHPTSKQKILILLTGMGPKRAYTAMSALLITQSVSKVVNLGVAGALHPHLQVGDLSTIEYAQMEKSSDEAFQNLDQITLCPLSDLPQHRLISVHTPVFDDKRRTRLAANADLVDMEGAAIAWACQQNHTPCQMLKGITDFAGVDERKMLHKNLSEVSNMLTTELFQQENIFVS